MKFSADDVCGTNPSVLLCFSHLRWDFVRQRPQHLMSRFARAIPVLYWEEPEYEAGATPMLKLRTSGDAGVTIATPLLADPESWESNQQILRDLLDRWIEDNAAPITRWYYTPMALPFSRHVKAIATIYDCMDELSAFKFAPPRLIELEAEMLRRADVVFTGGHSLYEAKRDRHANIHAFPSSVDVAHFAAARGVARVQGAAPTLGFFGVIDERIDLALIADLADRRPGWIIDMVGPIVKIDAKVLPQRKNIRWLGGASYADLPAHLARWDVAIMPFALNEATRFISPTKTPEYLAAGKPVVSTAITDVVRHYGDLAAVEIADGGAAFADACDALLALGREGSWLDEADALLGTMSWDATAAAMRAEIDAVIDAAPVVRERYDVVVVGAGFAGSVMAERLAADGDLKVLVIDRRPHIAGNAYDEHDAAGLLIHRYGPHIFHTNSDDVFAYLSRFTAWRAYEHRVLGEVDGKRVPIPINRTTLNALYDAGLETDDDAATFLAARAEPVANIVTSEDVVVNAIGRDLYEKFFRGYTRKQWALDPSELDKSVTARVPTRTNTDDRYFTDSHQAMPADGYTMMFARMLDHPNITVRLATDWRDLQGKVDYDHLVFTGPIDEYFDHRLGKLPYRSLRFVHETHDVAQFQPVGTVNHPNEATPFTRVSEYKHLTGQVHPQTSITYEYPAAEGDPYYPIPRPENQALFKRYEALALAEAGVTFVGRLATYRYYNMDQVVGQALATYRRLKPRLVAREVETAEAMAA